MWLMIELATYTKRALRRNESEFRVAETEVEIWLQIQKIEEDIRKAGNKSQLMLQRAKLKKNLSQRCRSMIEFTDYAKVISKLLTIRGLRKEFQGKNFPIFLGGRTVEFNVGLLEDMYESWHTLA